MRALLAIILALVVTSCTYSGSVKERALDDAQRLMPEDPAAALERLNGFDVAEFEDSATMARWALLYSEAMVANNYHAPTDTIVNIAISYYGRTNQTEALRHANRLKALMADKDRDALASALYLQKEKEFLLFQERATTRMYLLLWLSVIFIALCVIVWQRQRLRLRTLQNEALIAEAAGLRAGVAREQSACSDMASKLSALLESRFATLDSLCDTYYESQGTKTERKAIADKVKAHIEALKSDAGVFSEMECCVNDCRDGLLNNLRRELPTLKPEEYRLFVYLASNLSNRSIALLLGENIDVVYKRKSRLKAKIASSNTPHSPQLLSVF